MANSLERAILQGSGTTNAMVQLPLGTRINPDTGKERAVFASLRLNFKDADTGKQINPHVESFADAVALLAQVKAVKWRMPPLKGAILTMKIAPEMTGERAAVIIAHQEGIDYPACKAMSVEEHLAACGLESREANKPNTPTVPNVPTVPTLAQEIKQERGGAPAPKREKVGA